jgi:hypothetical protein
MSKMVQSEIAEEKNKIAQEIGKNRYFIQK